MSVLVLSSALSPSSRCFFVESTGVKSACLTALSISTLSSLPMPSPHRVKRRYFMAWSMHSCRLLALTALVNPGSLSEISTSASTFGHSPLTSRVNIRSPQDKRTCTLFISRLFCALTFVESPMTIPGLVSVLFTREVSALSPGRSCV